MERNETQHDPRHLGVPSGESKMIFEPTVRSMQTVHQSCVKISTISEKDWNELQLEPHHLMVPFGVSKMVSKPMVRLAQTMHLSCTDTNTISKWKEEIFYMTHVTCEFHRVCPKQFPRLTLLKQTVYLSCVKISTISKWTKMSFHLSLVTKEYHWVCPKRFMSRWYAWRKLCTYFALTLTLSPNVNKCDSTWPTSPRSSIGCVQNDVRAYGTFDANHTPILHRH
jgi:hypothetical protein